MATKRHMTVDMFTSPPKRAAISIDWDLCILCQEKTGEALQCPYAIKGDKLGTGYKSLADHLISFSQLGHMPMTVDLQQLDDGNGIEETLTSHHGVKVTGVKV